MIEEGVVLINGFVFFCFWRSRLIVRFGRVSLFLEDFGKDLVGVLVFMKKSVYNR